MNENQKLSAYPGVQIHGGVFGIEDDKGHKKTIHISLPVWRFRTAELSEGGIIVKESGILLN